MIKLKIAITLPKLENQGGINIVVNNLTNHLKKLNHDIHLFPIGKSTYKDSENIHIINSNKKTEQINIFREKFVRINSISSFNLIISNTLRSNDIINILNINTKTLMVFHAPKMLDKKDFFSEQLKKFRYKKLYKNKNLIALTDCFRNKFKDKFKNLEYKSFEVIYNGFDFEEIRKKSEKNFKKFNDEYIICVGRLTKTKNLDYAISIFNEVRKKRDNLHLVFLGEGNDREYFEKLVKELKIDKFVHFEGYQNNVFPWIYKAKLLLHTSKKETFGNILVESLCLNTPVVATNIECGPSEILRDELSEFLIPLADIETATKTVLKALEKYPEIKKEHIDIFDINNTANQYLSYVE